jgi:hypothetical protein
VNCCTDTRFGVENVWSRSCREKQNKLLVSTSFAQGDYNKLVQTQWFLRPTPLLTCTELDKQTFSNNAIKNLYFNRTQALSDGFSAFCLPQRTLYECHRYSCVVSELRVLRADCTEWHRILLFSNYTSDISKKIFKPYTVKVTRLRFSSAFVFFLRLTLNGKNNGVRSAIGPTWIKICQWLFTGEF